MRDRCLALLAAAEQHLTGLATWRTPQAGTMLAHCTRTHDARTPHAPECSLHAHCMHIAHTQTRCLCTHIATRCRRRACSCGSSWRTRASQRRYSAQWCASGRYLLVWGMHTYGGYICFSSTTSIHFHNTFTVWLSAHAGAPRRGCGAWRELCGRAAAGRPPSPAAELRHRRVRVRRRAGQGVRKKVGSSRARA